MSPNKSITIQIIPEDAGKILTWRVGYRTIRFFVYFLLILIACVLFALFKFATINTKAFTAAFLADKNKVLLLKQKQLDSLEQILTNLSQKTAVIGNIVNTFINVNGLSAEGDHNVSDRDLLSQHTVKKYISAVDSLQHATSSQTPPPAKYLPVIWPVRGIITKAFINDHHGIDIIAKPNSIIASPADGIVSEAGWHRDLGKFVRVKHGIYYQTVYGHLNRVFVKMGDHVKRGGSVGTLGNTGNSTGPHLHYEVLYNNIQVDPLNFLSN